MHRNGTHPKEPPTQPQLLTPILSKASSDLPWPSSERVFYILAKNGLFLCRNHPFYESCVPASTWPRELAEQKTFLQASYPRLSRELFERIVGFFSRVAERQNSEAAVLLVWDSETETVHPIVPTQTASVGTSYTGGTYPIGLHFDTPTDLPPHQVLFGDIHSHVNMPAYASGVDVHDEIHQPGLHIVIGQLDREPPDIHVEAVVDGSRFTLERDEVIEGYESRATDIPPEWIEMVELDKKPYRRWREYYPEDNQRYSPSTYSSAGNDSYYNGPPYHDPQEDQTKQTDPYSSHPDDDRYGAPHLPEDDSKPDDGDSR